MALSFTEENLNLFLDFGNTRKLATLLKNIPEDVQHISAAVAYTTEKRNPNDISLVDICINKKIKLDWWGLFTADCATSPSEIRKALEHPDLITFYPFAENFHAKVIHFHGYGIYIGSHNFTYNAMMYNVEAGVFIKEEFLSEKQKNDIESFFSYLSKNKIPAVKDDIEKIEEFIKFISEEEKQEDEIKKRRNNFFKKQFAHMFLLRPGVQEGSESTRNEKKKLKAEQDKRDFIEEWRSTQNTIAHIKDLIRKNCQQPSWISKEADLTIITDQVLHAYFYSYLLRGYDERKSSLVVEEEKKKNSGRSEDAILEAIRWWEQLENAPSSENIYINEWGISNRRILDNLRKRDLTKEELTQVMLQNHAARNHARQIENSTLNLPPDFKTSAEERVKIYVDWLITQKSKDNLNVNDVMKYLLFGTGTLEDRVYDCINNPHYKIEHFGRSIIGELLGWGRPDITHIRNNRVNKALRALGYEIQLFSE